MLGTMEIVTICGVIVILFGAGAIPKFARSIGKARKEFEKGLKEDAIPESLPEKTSDPTPPSPTIL